MKTLAINIWMRCQLLSVKRQIDPVPVGKCVRGRGPDAILIKIPVVTGESMVEFTSCNTVVVKEQEKMTKELQKLNFRGIFEFCAK